MSNGFPMTNILAAAFFKGSVLTLPPLSLPQRHGGAWLSRANGSKTLHVEGKLQSCAFPADVSAAVAIKLRVLLVFLRSSEQEADRTGMEK